MDDHDRMLLEAFGFQEKEPGLWTFRKQVEEKGEAIGEAVAVVQASASGVYRGWIPMADDGVAAHGRDAVPDNGLFFDSEDVRDMIALAQGEIGNVWSRAGSVPPDDREAFVDEKTATLISMPFNGDPYSDYLLAERSGEGPHRLAPPTDAFGDAYTEWRDGFCEGLAASASPRAASI